MNRRQALGLGHLNRSLPWVVLRSHQDISSQKGIIFTFATSRKEFYRGLLQNVISIVEIESNLYSFGPYTEHKK